MNKRKGMDKEQIGKLAFRIPEVAHLLSLSESMVKNLIRDKHLGHIKPGRVTLVTREHLECFVSKLERESRRRD